MYLSETLKCPLPPLTMHLLQQQPPPPRATNRATAAPPNLIAAPSILIAETTSEEEVGRFRGTSRVSSRSSSLSLPSTPSRESVCWVPQHRHSDRLAAARSR